jgi:hypothetical protein
VRRRSHPLPPASCPFGREGTHKKRPSAKVKRFLLPGHRRRFAGVGPVASVSRNLWTVTDSNRRLRGVEEAIKLCAARTSFGLSVQTRRLRAAARVGLSRCHRCAPPRPSSNLSSGWPMRTHHVWSMSPVELPCGLPRSLTCWRARGLSCGLLLRFHRGCAPHGWEVNARLSGLPGRV